LKTNTGFAEGTNVAAREARGRTLVLLNNDTIPDPHWLAELLRAAAKSPSGMAASKLVFAHDPTRINSTGLILLRDGRGADRGFRRPDDGRYERTEPVFAGCGAALALPAPGPGQPVFDPRLFLYSEDLDLEWRVRLAGGGVVYAPRSLVRHVHGAAAGDRSPLFAFYNERNRALVALRNGDPVLAVWSAAVLFAKAGRAVVQREPTARAVAAAAVSYLWHAPRVLAERLARRR
jgi:GT2 family glycosyltransferase